MSVSIQKQRGAVTFKADKGLNPEALQKTFEQFGSVGRVLVETKATSVAWERKAPVQFPGTYPEVAVEIAGNLPVEVAVIGSFAPGEGERFYHRSVALQAQHLTFVDEYNEASAKIANADFSRDDPTTIYTFSVGTQDLVFHRHAGHRAITGITGSGGANLKFSAATPEEAASNPDVFVEKMFIIEIPADSMFVLRFSGTVYHQFGPSTPGKDAFFAISVHTNEAGGLEGELLDIVKAGNGSIPLLTEPISDAVADLLDGKKLKKLKVKDRQRRTVSATKRYMTRVRNGDAPAEGAAPLSGNHAVEPEVISHEVATILREQVEQLRERIVHFSLPRLATIYSPPQDTYIIEFDGEQSDDAVDKALAAAITTPDGLSLTLERACRIGYSC
ncbi:uncharacterized protein ACA1_396930 [Acanthamoeba castellanii str. Neff]|uniref:Uncharacterized protein n=1 Tax=Acanthamoeba castellanii (strain ATCC 30010 / Neff) TaxID=1257118 RepID=L8HCA2_ACACF|nr:uncharacterized protein ACA1_396930 [Acanthamoeba castellanii str. Neff]ELR22867.1 hypothetical protein ACA1_396930 [Acanthamoeba castellanii str. Neff]